MNRYKNACDGLKMIFYSEIIAIVCSILLFIPVLGTIVGVYGMLACQIVGAIGLFFLGRDIEGCKLAFILTIVGIVINVAGNFSGLSILFGIIGCVINFLIVFYICKPLSAALTSLGALQIADKGSLVWKINLVCYAILIVVKLVSIIPFINILAALVGGLTGLVQLVANIIYFIFLFQSYKFFQTY